MNNEFREISEVLTEADLFNIDTEATKKACFLAINQKHFELLYNKYYLELSQEKAFEKMKMA